MPYEDQYYKQQQNALRQRWQPNQNFPSRSSQQQGYGGDPGMAHDPRFVGRDRQRAPNREWWDMAGGTWDASRGMWDSNLDPNTFMPQRLPGGRIAQDVQFDVNRATYAYNRQMRDSAQRAIGNQMRSAQTYRPGSQAHQMLPAAMGLSSTYMQSQIDPPDVMYWGRRDAELRARKAARRAGYLQAGMGLLNAAASVAGAAVGGGAPALGLGLNINQGQPQGGPTSGPPTRENLAPGVPWGPQAGGMQQGPQAGPGDQQAQLRGANANMAQPQQAQPTSMTPGGPQGGPQGGPTTGGPGGPAGGMADGGGAMAGAGLGGGGMYGKAFDLVGDLAGAMGVTPDALYDAVLQAEPELLAHLDLEGSLYRLMSMRYADRPADFDQMDDEYLDFDRSYIHGGAME